MKQEDFEQRYTPDWEALEGWLREMEKRRAESDQSVCDSTRVPALYRRVCHHLALARRRGYSPALQERLNQMALGGHRHLYASRPRIRPRLIRFVSVGFPTAFRENWRFMSLSAFLFATPMIALIVAVQVEPMLVYSVISPWDAARFEQMYDPDNRVLGRERGSASDFSMFGHYIYNNVSIALRMFGGGILAGIGTIGVLFFNGLFLGTIAGHLTYVGFTSTFWSFVVGHGALELTALIIAGGAGLKLGYAIWAPGRRRRIDALIRTARQCLPLIYGASVMLVLAAIVEAYWSSTTWLPPSSKYLAGASLWLLVGIYLLCAGRRDGR